MPFWFGSCPSAVSTFIPASGFFGSDEAACFLLASISAADCNVTIAIIHTFNKTTTDPHRSRGLGRLVPKSPLIRTHPRSSTDLALVSRSNLSVRRRSEEHTSELQSRRDLVCRLL